MLNPDSHSQNAAPSGQGGTAAEKLRVCAAAAGQNRDGVRIQTRWAEVHPLISDAAKEVIYEVNTSMPGALASTFSFRQRHPGPDLPTHDVVGEVSMPWISLDTKIAAMGSCFMAGVRRELQRLGLQVLQCEEGPGTVHASARLGRLFAAPLYFQTAERALGSFNPDPLWWPVGEILIDPYRQGVAWPDEASARCEMAEHQQALHRMFSDADVLICTLGTSEVWRDRVTGLTFHWVPPDPIFDPSRHEHVVLSVEENEEMLVGFVDRARTINAKLKFIFIVTPIPIAMTFADQSAVIADVISKATLRLAVDRVTRARDDVSYFPAFEVLRRIDRDPWTKDLRHITQAAYQRLMGPFLRMYGKPSISGRSAPLASASA